MIERRARRAFTMIGLPSVRGTLRTKGRNGQIAARLWDVSGGRQRLISRGVYRLTPDHKGRVVSQLTGNAYRIGKGHMVLGEVVEAVGGRAHEVEVRPAWR